MFPFDYPAAAHVRRHGPAGYSAYESYRDWLRDEFTFRCVYCLTRERWGKLRGAFHLDHFTAQIHDEEAILDYDNLLYACASCNLGKGDVRLPDPCSCMLSGHVSVSEDGTISGSTPEARKTIAKLQLDAADYREYRAMLIGIVRLASASRPDLYQRLTNYPDDLPNLSSLRPPHNTRPNGIRDSSYERKLRGELPESY